MWQRVALAPPKHALRTTAPVMASYTSDIVLGSAIVAVLGVAAYISVQPKDLISEQRAASVLYAKAWGKQWPDSKGTISKAEICGDETGFVDEDVGGALADFLEVDAKFDYRYLEDIRSLQIVLGANPGDTEKDFLVVRKEYEILRKALEEQSKSSRSILLTGHAGIGSYEPWF